jgi:hypothetical protein
MAFARGKDTQVYATDAGGTQRELTAYTDSMSSNFESDILDTTVFGSAYRSSIRGFLGFSGSLSGKWDSAATATPDQWLVDLITAASTVVSTLTWFPNGSAAGRKYERAAVYFSNYQKESAVDDIVTWSCDYELASGSVTVGTA